MQNDVELTVSNKNSVKDVKLKFLEERKIEKGEIEAIRLFVNGKELKDKEKIWALKLENLQIVQAFVKRSTNNEI